MRIPLYCTKSVAIFLVFLSFAMPASAQAPITLLVDRVNISDFPQVTVRFSAWDASGLPIPDLEPEDVTLQEDDGTPFSPSDLESDTDADLSIVLVVDVSGSMDGQPLDDAKVAAARFLDRLTEGDNAALIAFSEDVNPDPAILDPERESGFTSELGPLYDKIEALRALGGTELYNALTKAVRMFEGQPAGHRAILILSDGKNDPANVGDPDEGVLLAKQLQIPVFVIGLGNQVDEDYLRSLTQETGGLYRSAPQSSELADLFADMASLLKTQYRMSYSSKLVPDGGLHNLTIGLQSGEAVQAEVKLGPLPPAPTEAATEVVLPSPTPEPTQAPIISTKAVPSTVPTDVSILSGDSKADPSAFPWYWIVVALGLVTAGGWFFLHRREPKPRPEVCSKCGYDLTGKSGACPSCGSTERLPKYDSKKK